MLVQERFAWVWVCSLVIIFGGYFAAVAFIGTRGQPSIGQQIGVLAIALSALAVVAAGTWLAGRVGRSDQRDERDRAIARRSSATAYSVLMAGMILVGVVMPFSAGGWVIVHAALLAIGVAEIVHHGMIVVSYRRGWHG